jgi:hypothetical protein
MDLRQAKGGFGPRLTSSFQEILGTAVAESGAGKKPKGAKRAGIVRRRRSKKCSP